jgi:hypothetical protein
MSTKLMLIVLSALLFQACAEMNDSSRKRDAMMERARTCATCGGSVSDNYFAGSAFKAVGPGNY